MALVGVELETLVSEPDAPTIRPPPCATASYLDSFKDLLQKIICTKAFSAIESKCKKNNTKMQKKLIFGQFGQYYEQRCI